MKFTEKEIDGKLWICDKDKNMASVEKWGSKEGAEKALASLVDCTDCNNCYNCDNCDNSSYCNNCSNCNDCHDCHDCANCNTCTGCTYTLDRENYHRQEKAKEKATPTIAITNDVEEIVWISVKDSLPNQVGTYLVQYGLKGQFTFSPLSEIVRNQEAQRNGETSSIIAWAQMPKGYQGKDTK